MSQRRSVPTFAIAAGCTDQSPDCLRKLTTGQILAIQKPYMINQTIVDGDFMPMLPGEALRTGHFNDVTLVNGSNRDEGTFFVGFPENENGLTMSEQSYPTAIQGFFGKELAQRVEAEYPTAGYNSPSDAFAAASTDYLFACPAIAVDRWASTKTSVYAYEFADRTAPSYLKPTSFPLGAAHTFELPYIFTGFRGGSLGLPVSLNPLQEKLSEEMIRYWTTVSDASRWDLWPKYDPSEQNFLRIMLPEPHVLPVNRFHDDHHCQFWDNAGTY